MNFYCVNDNVPKETIDSLEKACLLRNIKFEEINAYFFDFISNPCNLGDILFRPAVSQKAIQVEQFLHNKKIASFYATPDGVFFPCTNPTLIHTRSGLPVPRYYTCMSFNPQLLIEQVNLLGGFPVIVKIPGASRGIGVIRVDSLATLLSLIEYLCAQGWMPKIMTYIPNSIHWRVVVVGDRSVAAYTNPTIENDFRTVGTQNLDEIMARPSSDLERIAVRSVHTLKLEFGGVDLLQHESGRIYLLETNFPCYFAHAQIYGNIDVAGEIIEYLAKKADNLKIEPTN